MKYYTITNDGLLIANNTNALISLGEVKELPADYEQGKYIVENNELVLNHVWEEEQKQKDKQRKIIKLEQQMETIDKKRIRAVCENEQKDETTTWLEYYNSIIRDLREQLTKLL